MASARSRSPALTMASTTDTSMLACVKGLVLARAMFSACSINVPARSRSPIVATASASNATVRAAVSLVRRRRMRRAAGLDRLERTVSAMASARTISLAARSTSPALATAAAIDTSTLACSAGEVRESANERAMDFARMINVVARSKSPALATASPTPSRTASRGRSWRRHSGRFLECGRWVIEICPGYRPHLNGGAMNAPFTRPEVSSDCGIHRIAGGQLACWLTCALPTNALRMLARCARAGTPLTSSVLMAYVTATDAIAWALCSTRVRSTWPRSSQLSW